MSTNKDNKVETLRGIAIIMVVMTHVIGGLQLPHDNYWNYIFSSLQFIRMPLFTVISGFVYAYKPIVSGDERKFLFGKSRRLLLTFSTLSPIYFILRFFFQNNYSSFWNEFYKIYIYPIVGFWYLQALFIIFLLIIVLERKKFLNKFNQWFFIVLLAFVPYLFYQNIPYEFSIRGAAYLLPYFLIGIGLNRFKTKISELKINIFYILVFLTSFIYLEFTIFYEFKGLVDYDFKLTIVPILAAVSLIFLIFQFNFQNKKLIFIGGYSYSIFLFHPLFCVFFRMVFIKIGIDSSFILVLGITIVGVLLPILLEHLLLKNSYLSLLFLGKSFYKKSTSLEPIKGI